MPRLATLRSASLERAAAPLDAGRRAVLAVALRVPLFAHVLSRRDRRVVVQACVGLSVTLALTWLAPTWLFALGPLLFGVPHVAADVRYLVVQQRLPRAFVALVAAGCAAMLGVRVLEVFFASRALWLPYAEVSAGAVLAGTGAVAGGLVSDRRGRAALVLGGVGLVFALGLRDPYLFRLLFAHAHNLVAITLWLVLFRRARGAAIPVLVALGLALALLLTGVVRPSDAGLGVGAGGRDLRLAAAWLAPGLPAGLALSVALSYVFLQAVHYAVWLGWIPQETVAGEGTTTFRMSARNLVRDFGWPGLAVIGAGMLTMAAASVVSLHEARNAYLSLATFHGYLEVAVLAFFLARGRASEACSSAPDLGQRLDDHAHAVGRANAATERHAAL